MNLQNHYLSYKKSFEKDVLPGTLEFTKNVPTKKPEQYPTVESFFKHVTNCIKMTENEKPYFKWLRIHQETALQVFSKMVDEELKKFDKPRDLSILDLSYQKGHQYFKFSNFVIEFDKFKLIPRYSPKFIDSDFVEVMLDADEWFYFIQSGNQGLARRVLEKKQQALDNNNSWMDKLTKIWARENGDLEAVPINNFNVDEIIDWTLPLRPGEK